MTDSEYMHEALGKRKIIPRSQQKLKTSPDNTAR